jgi:hypothetical protein
MCVRELWAALPPPGGYSRRTCGGYCSRCSGIGCSTGRHHARSRLRSITTMARVKGPGDPGHGFVDAHQHE